MVGICFNSYICTALNIIKRLSIKMYLHISSFNNRSSNCIMNKPIAAVRQLKLILIQVKTFYLPSENCFIFSEITIKTIIWAARNRTATNVQRVKLVEVHSFVSKIKKYTIFTKPNVACALQPVSNGVKFKREIIRFEPLFYSTADSMMSKRQTRINVTSRNKRLACDVERRFRGSAISLY